MANEPGVQAKKEGDARRQRNRILTLGACVILGVGVGLYQFPASESFQFSSLNATVAGTKDRPVEIQAGLSQNLFEDEQTAVPIRVSIVNHGTSALSDVMVCAEAPGFELKQRDNCVTAKGLEPLGQMTSEIPITPLDHSSVGMITVRVFWRQGTAEISTLRLGPVKVDPKTGALRWNRFGQRLASILKDLTWPVILALLGAWLSRKQEKREEERQRIEKELSDRQQVRLLLLEKTIKLAEEHYLPIAAQAGFVLAEADRIERKEVMQSPDKLFFHLVMLLRFEDYMGTSKQVVFLQTRIAEDVVQRALQLMRTASFGAMGEALALRALRIVDVTWNFATFLDRKDELRELQAAFDAWFAGSGFGAATFGRFSDYLGVFDVVSSVIQREADRPLSADWYEEDQKLGFALPETTLPAGDNLPKSQRDQAVGLKDSLDEYMKGFYEWTVKLKTD